MSAYETKQRQQNQVFGPHSRPAYGRRLLYSLALLGAVANLAKAQISTDFISRSSPQPPFPTPEAAEYPIKIGNMNARLYGSMQLEYNDNINLSMDDPRWDISFAPNARVGFVWPVSQEHTMQMNLGIGYRWYLRSPAISSFTIDPTSRLDHKMLIGDVQITVSDAFSLQVDPTTRGEISGTGSEVIDFRRFRNTAGLLANWAPRDDLSLSAAYDYTIDRSISAGFESLDRDEHTFSAGVYHMASSRLTVGISSSYTITDYSTNVQNDGRAWSIGPNAIYNLSEFVIANGSLSYTLSEYDLDTGSITDTSEFRGWTYRGGIRHQVNRRISHELQLSKYIASGLGSNFTETFSTQYSLNLRLSSAMLLSSTFALEKLDVSGSGGEQADRILFHLGATLELSRNWTAGLGYALSRKDSDQAGRDYTQNRITVDIARTF